VTLHETQLVAYSAGSLIHAALAMLVLNLYRHTTGKDRVVAVERIAVCLSGFFWQFGNLWETSGMFHPLIGSVMLYSALVTFPLWFGYSLHEPTPYSRAATLLTGVGRAFRYPQWVLTVVSIFSGFQQVLGRHPLIDPDLAVKYALRIMLFYFLLFITVGMIRRRKARDAEDAPTANSRRLILILMPITAIMFVVILYYPGALRGNAGWLELAARMMSIPSTIGTAYRLYRFPFMDVFLRETLTGMALLTAFCFGFSVGPQDDWWPLWIASLAMGIAVARAPLSRAVERKFLGYDESAEEQEERVGAALRNLTQLREFDEKAAQVLRREIGADWVKISGEPRD